MIFDVENICGGGDNVFAYKIIEKQFIDNITKDGQIYFGLLSGYRTMENKNMAAIGDRQEASLTKLVEQYIEVNGEFLQIHGRDVGYRSRVNANQCAFCFYVPGLKCFTREGDNHYSYVLPYSDIETICKDKGGIENCAVIIFGPDVVQKICAVLRKRGMNYANGRIQYDDFDYIPKHEIHTKEYALECAFHKAKRYAYQKEYRITALNTRNAPITDLHIDVEPDDFDVIELKEGYELYCDTEIKAHREDNLVKVDINCLYSLEPKGNMMKK